MSEEVTKRRAARYLPADSGVRPYSRLQAEGYKLLFELEKVTLFMCTVYYTRCCFGKQRSSHVLIYWKN